MLPLDEIDIALNAVEEASAGEEASRGAAAASSSEQSSGQSNGQSSAGTARRRWVRATRHVLAEEKRKSIIFGAEGASAQRAAAASSAARPQSPGGHQSHEAADAPLDSLSAIGIGLQRAGIDATPGAEPPGKYVSVVGAAWSNLLTIAEGQITGDTAGWMPDDHDDIFGSEREALHLIHHGRGGGVYKAWASSEAESRKLVELLLKLQGELLHREQSLRAHIQAARNARKNAGRRRSSLAQWLATAIE